VSNDCHFILYGNNWGAVAVKITATDLAKVSFSEGLIAVVYSLPGPRPA
jgi:hypothetical protein